MSTPRAPNSDQRAISTAPVSEAGTMPMQCSAGTSSTSRVRVTASLRRALPSPERCERPISAVLRRSGVQPGILAHGPDENCGFAGRNAGLAVVMLFSILADGLTLVGEG